MSTPSLSAPQFSIFTALVEDRAGLSYTLADKSIFESKLWSRALEAGFESALDYYYFLRYDDPTGSEMQALVQTLVVHETFFFRELGALRAAVTYFVKPRVEAGHRARIWCSACSTGEEPATLAMLLASTGLLPSVELLASDISENALIRARSGRFTARALRYKCPPWAEPYLKSVDNGFTVAPELLSAIQFRRLNLLDREAIASVGTLDLIVCRNVLIYFRDDTTRCVVNTLKQQLRPDGALLVGVSESLMRFETGLACGEHSGVFVYRKVAS